MGILEKVEHIKMLNTQLSPNQSNIELKPGYGTKTRGIYYYRNEEIYINPIPSRKNVPCS